MAGATAQELGVVFFRFKSSAEVETIEFMGREIAVGDLKQAIAEKKSLPRFDIVLVNDATQEVYPRDGAMLCRGTSVTVRRTPPQNRKRPSVVEVESLDIWNRVLVKKDELKDEPMREAPVKKRACPEEYICPLCRQIFQEPSIARCCGKSACAGCLQKAYMKSACPICEKPWATGRKRSRVLPNTCLADAVASLDLEYFTLPEAKVDEDEDITLMTVKKAPIIVWGPPSCPAPEPGPFPMPTAPWPGMPPMMGAPPPGMPPMPMPAHPLMPLPMPPTPRPGMLSPEQFLAWQHSVHGPGAGRRSRAVEPGMRAAEPGGARRRKRHGSSTRRPKVAGRAKGPVDGGVIGSSSESER